MLLRRQRSHYQQLIKFKRDHIIGLRDGGFFPHDISEDMARMYPLCMIVESRGQGIVLPQKDRVSGGYVALMGRKIAVFGVRLWLIVMHLRKKFELQLVPQ
ncbi:uncharacterized protein TNCV_1733721 [Trichonephila clavipes]|nr:uncharacterized protein TNCV_1733721 [Trichonephila clavipes]